MTQHLTRNSKLGCFLLSVLVCGTTVRAQDPKIEKEVRSAIEGFERKAAGLKGKLLSRIASQRAAFAKIGDLERIRLADRERQRLQDSGDLPSCVGTVDYRKSITSEYERAVVHLLSIRSRLTKKGDVQEADKVSEEMDTFATNVRNNFPGTLILRTAWVHSIGRFVKINAGGEWVEITDHGRKSWIEFHRDASGIALRNIDNTSKIFLYDDRCESQGIKGKRKLVFRGQWRD